jgi:hypothetical protein
MNLIVKSPVWDDLRTIGLRIAKDNPDAAERFLTEAEADWRCRCQTAAPTCPFSPAQPALLRKTT